MPVARFLTACLAAASLLACASTPHPGSSTTAGALEEPLARESGDLRVMTFNIQSGAQGLEAVAEVIRAAGADIVALQEVDVGSRRAKGKNQVAELAARTGLTHHAHFRTTDLHGGAYGVALLSRFPMEARAQHPLPVPEGSEPRTLAHVVLRVGERAVSVYATHLSRRPFNGRVRQRQSVAILRLFEKDPRPKLLLGDLNDDPDSLPVRLLRRELTDVFAAAGQGPSGTYPLPLFLPTLRIDYVLADSAFSACNSRVLRGGASDHYPVIADVHLKEQALAHHAPGPVGGGGGPRALVK